jgi:regulator of sigma E protease
LALSLSISLAVLNLLPIPVLDGGQIVMSSLEELFPRLVRYRGALTAVGAFLLVSLMVYANVKDVVRIWG